jgi:hypothetical protein
VLLALFATLKSPMSTAAGKLPVGELHGGIREENHTPLRWHRRGQLERQHDRGIHTRQQGTRLVLSHIGARPQRLNGVCATDARQRGARVENGSDAGRFANRPYVTCPASSLDSWRKKSSASFLAAASTSRDPTAAISPPT